MNPDMESISWARVVLACVAVGALLALMGFVLKNIKMRGFALPGASEGRRLELLESLPLDTRRRLVLVRCDKAEHLILLGLNEDIVIGAKAPARAAPKTPAKPPAGLRTKSEA